MACHQGLFQDHTELVAAWPIGNPPSSLAEIPLRVAFSTFYTRSEGDPARRPCRLPVVAQRLTAFHGIENSGVASLRYLHVILDVSFDV